MRSIGAKYITINRLRIVQGHVDALRRAAPPFPDFRKSGIPEISGNGGAARRRSDRSEISS